MANLTLVEQIINEVIEFIALAVFPEGSKIPSVRNYAQMLGINPNTVQKAYQYLEENGHIQTIEKKGSFVVSKEYTTKIYRSILMEQFQEIVKNMHKGGITKAELDEIVFNVYKGGDY